MMMSVVWLSFILLNIAAISVVFLAASAPSGTALDVVRCCLPWWVAPADDVPR